MLRNQSTNFAPIQRHKNRNLNKTQKGERRLFHFHNPESILEKHVNKNLHRSKQVQQSHPTDSDVHHFESL